jgi:hypothetical protein
VAIAAILSRSKIVSGDGSAKSPGNSTSQPIIPISISGSHQPIDLALLLVQWFNGSESESKKPPPLDRSR